MRALEKKLGVRGKGGLEEGFGSEDEVQGRSEEGQGCSRGRKGRKKGSAEEWMCRKRRRAAYLYRR